MTINFIIYIHHPVFRGMWLGGVAGDKKCIQNFGKGMSEKRQLGHIKKTKTADCENLK